MRQCLNCGGTIPNRILIDGRIRNLKNRKYCITCSPFGQHNTRKIEKDYVPRNKRYVVNVKNRRNKIRDMAVSFLGGKCEKCGYDKCRRALCFHHINQEDKAFSISDTGKAWDSVLIEIMKCALLCHNCHMELHEGMWTITDIRREAHVDVAQS